ncbi:MAG: glycosyltransferase [Phycisphaerales bacterium]
MRVLLCSIGSHGDIHPYVAVARALRARGHEAAVVANPYFRGVVEGAGVPFLPLGGHIDLAEAIRETPGAMAQFGGSMKLVRNWLMPLLEEHTRSLMSHARSVGAGVIVGHTITFPVPMVCEKLGLRFVASSLAPVGWMNANDQPCYSALDRTWPPLTLCRLNLWVGRLMMRWRIDAAVNRVRAGLGLRPVREAWYSQTRGGELNLGLWSPIFRGGYAGDPATGVICGFPWEDRAAGHEDDMERVEAFLDAGEAPLVFTLGTASVHVAGKYFGAAAEAARVLGRRAMLVAGRREYAPADLPAGVEVFTYAPYSRVFPRALVNVHHGGIGTTAQSLRAGRPALVTPMSHDQFDNSARLKRLGVGDRINFSAVTSGGLAGLLRHLIEDRAINEAARALGPRVAAEDGASVAAEAIIGRVGGGAKASGNGSQQCTARGVGV